MKRKTKLTLLLLISMLVRVVPSFGQTAQAADIGSLALNNPAISMTSTVFDKDPAKQADAIGNITWNDSSIVTDVKQAEVSIGTDAYVVSGSAITFKKEYLVQQPVGALGLSVEFDVGDPVNLYFDIIDTKGFMYTEVEGKIRIDGFTAPDDFDGTLTIPDTLAGLPVTAINGRAFYGQTKLMNVYLPDSITTLGFEAFNGCNQLKQVKLPDSIILLPIGLFRDCISLESIIIPDTVKTIGSEAFDGCSSLKHIDIPYGVTSIGEFTFYECTKLESVTIPNSVTTIGDWAFRFCTNLNNVIIPDSVTTIGECAFYLCTSLVSIKIPASVNSIGNEAFVGSNAATIYGYDGSYVQEYAEENDINFSIIKDMEPVLPKTASFNKALALQENLIFTINWEDAAAIIEITKDGLPISTSAYHVLYDTLTINKDWLSTQTVGSFDLGITFNNGKSTIVTINITDSDSSVHSAYIIPSLLSFDRSLAKQSDVTASIQWNDASSILDIKREGSSIGKASYLIGTDTITIKKEYLSTVTLGRLELTVVFDVGDESVIAIDITDSNGFLYTISSNEATLTGFLAPEEFSGHLIVPATLGGKPVTGIGNNAFENNSELTGIELPDTIRSIGDFAFSNCNQLLAINLPRDLIQINQYAFYNCSYLRTVTCSNQLTSIGEYAFSDCYRLDSIILPESLSYIGASAFAFCSGLQSIVIPDRVTGINQYSFRQCYNLKMVTLSKNIRYITAGAFFACPNLTEIVLPEGLTGLYYGAFDSCSQLTSVIIPDSVVTIHDDVFNGCDKLTIYAHEGSLALRFAKKLGMDYVAIPYQAFISPTMAYFDKELTKQEDVSITITWNDATAITDIAHEGSSLTVGSYWVEGNILTISKDYLANQSAGTLQLTLKFDKGPALQLMIQIKEAVGLNYSIIDSKAVITGFLPPIDFMGTLELPSTINGYPVTNIGDNAFENCLQLIRMQLPEPLVNIGEQAFSGCSNLEQITFGRSNTMISASAFTGCSKLVIYGYPNSSAMTYANLNSIAFVPIVHSATISQNLYHFDRYPTGQKDIITSITWNDANMLVDIKLQDQSIGQSAYRLKGNVLTIKKEFLATQQNGTNVLTLVFNHGDPIPLTVEIDDSMGLEFEEEEGQLFISGFNFDTSFDGNLMLPAVIFNKTIRGFQPGAFYDCDSLLTVRIPGSYETINAGAFNRCVNLETVIIEEGITYIDDYAFSECIKLTDINLPESLTEIGYYTFADCLNLTKMVIPNNMTEVGVGAFYGCEKLQSVILSDKMEVISVYMFAGCTNLRNVVIPNSMIYIGYMAFYGCESLSQIELPSSVKNISIAAFSDCINLKQVTFQGYDTLIESEGEYHAFTGSDNVTIRCYEGSKPAKFAKDFNIPCQYITNDPILYYATAQFQKEPERQRDISVNVYLNSAKEVTDIKYNDLSIGKESYSVSNGVITIKKEFLATLSNGPTVLVIEFDQGMPVRFYINISGRNGVVITNSLEGIDSKAKLTILEKDHMGIISMRIDLEGAVLLDKIEEATSDDILEITVPITSDYLIKQIMESGGKSVLVNLTLSDTLLEKDGIKVRLNLDDKLLYAAKDTNMDFKFVVTDEHGKERYSWIFTADNLLASKRLSDKSLDTEILDLSLHIKSLNSHKGVSELLGITDDNTETVIDGFVISLGHEGVFPTQASIKVYVGDRKDFNPGDYVYLYYYNSKTNRLDTLPYSSNYRVDKDGYITMDLVHGSDYVILDRYANSKIRTLLLDQITVSSSEKVIYLGGTKQTTAEVIINLPYTLELVKHKKDKASMSAIGAVEVWYRSSNEKVVVIDNEGRMIAKGKGRARIDVTIILYNNKMKDFSFYIDVKEPYIEITKSTEDIEVGDKYVFEAKGYGIDEKLLTWRTTKKSILTIHKKTGVATAVSKGTDYVLVSAGEQNRKLKVVVK